MEEIPNIDRLTPEQLEGLFGRVQVQMRRNRGIPDPPPLTAQDLAPDTMQGPPGPPEPTVLTDEMIVEVVEEGDWGHRWPDPGPQDDRTGPWQPQQPQVPPEDLPQAKWGVPPRPPARRVAPPQHLRDPPVPREDPVPRQSPPGSRGGSPCASERSRSDCWGSYVPTQRWLHHGAHEQYHHRAVAAVEGQPSYRDWGPRKDDLPPDPRDPPAPAYDREAGVQKLKFLERVPVPPGPYPHATGEDVTSYHWALLSWCKANARTIPEERTKYLENLYKLYQEPPPYWTLDASENLKEWRTLLEEDPSIEWDQPQILGYWNQVLMHPHAGAFEANRILFHLIKQTRVARDGWNVPGWFINTCKESIEALNNWSAWNAYDQRQNGYQYLESGYNGSRKAYQWVWQGEPRAPQDPRGQGAWYDPPRQPAPRGPPAPRPSSGYAYGWSQASYRYPERRTG